MRQTSVTLSSPAGSLSAEQRAAFNAAVDSVVHSRRETFTLFGGAGCGKTHVLSELAERFPQAILAAPTGKSAAVLRSRTGRPAHTVHSLFYKLREWHDSGRLKFDPAYENDALHGQLVLLDEAGLVPRRMGEQLLDMGLRIVAVADPYQLGPISGAPFFDHPDFELRQVHRQAADSPILRQAYNAKKFGAYRSDAEFVCKYRPTDADYLAADMVLVHTNTTRHAVNELIRDLRGFYGKQPRTGESVLCLQNCARFSVWNGETYRLKRDFSGGALCIENEGTEQPIPGAQFVREGEVINPECTTAFCFGYALTVHKSQGSEWPFVILIDEFPTHADAAADRQRWLYTGITRSQSRMIFAERF